MPKNIQGWYRGVVANAGAVAPITAFQMAVNGGLERLILAGDTSRELQAHEKIGAAMGAGAADVDVHPSHLGESWGSPGRVRGTLPSRAPS